MLEGRADSIYNRKRRQTERNGDKNEDKKVLHGFLTAAAAVSLILILLLSAFEIAAYSDFGFYQKEYEKYEIQETLPMEMDDIMDVTEKMMSYLRGDREELSVMTTIDGERQDFLMSRTGSTWERSGICFLEGLPSEDMRRLYWLRR